MLMSPNKVDSFLANALASKEFSRAWIQISKEKIARAGRPARCTAIEIPEVADAKDFASIAPGTVAAFIGQEGDPLLSQLLKAVKENKSAEFNAAAAQVKRLEADVLHKITAATICPPVE